MAFPGFFARIPAVTLGDPLAELLGAADGGLIEYRFADAVRRAGHSENSADRKAREVDLE